MLPPLAEDPRLDEALDLFNRGDFEDASDLMEELFFEAAGAERPVARVLLQLFVGMVHIEQRQFAPARERLDVGIEEARSVRDWLGLDGERLTRDIETVVRQLAAGEFPLKPSVRRKAGRSPE
jgi:hypothetical protein